MHTGPLFTSVIVFAPAVLHREAWCALLSGQPSIAVAGAAGDLDDLRVLLQPKRPAAILIDLPAPQPSHVRGLQDAAAGSGLLVLVASYELAEVVALLQAGAAGCVSRDESAGDLARAVIAAGRGEIVVPPSIASRVLALLAHGGPAGDAPGAALSERERTVLCLLAQGCTNKDIAQTLILSVRTVEAHLRNIFAKLGLSSRTEAALWAVRHGYGPEREP